MTGCGRIHGVVAAVDKQRERDKVADRSAGSETNVGAGQ